ncbi:response regulator [Marivirga sp. S37H4]|uniref:Response regulator n=1 Tax=Marivirga aurantiaca TaxID=2802615 RepID=A0A934WW39_9BACT|nr:response regulator [Marivirga aurantiaca]MBK6264138.1 response regulator [Marivirga aurantiaca]
MNTLPKKINFLMIEDNKGDQYLVSDYLNQEFHNIGIQVAETCEEAMAYMNNQNGYFDLILLDLTLPDMQGDELVRKIIEQGSKTPIIVLTGYSDFEFSVKSLALGVSDYLLKDTLTPSSLFKSITYTLERKVISQQLSDSHERYQELFHLNPQPVFIVSVENLSILDVNEAAISKYKCDREDFLQLKMYDIQDDFNQELVEYFLKNKSFELKQTYFHQCMDNEESAVDLKGNLLEFKGKKAILLLAIDITERYQYTRKIERQNKKLSDIAWHQSHMVRAPLSRLMGLIDVFEMQHRKMPVILPEELQFLLRNILSSAHEIDKVIKDIVHNTYDEDENE